MSLGRLIYSSLLPVFLAHSSDTARVQRPPSPPSDSAANRTVTPALKANGVRSEAKKARPSIRTTPSLKEGANGFIGDNLFQLRSNSEVSLASSKTPRFYESAAQGEFVVMIGDGVFIRYKGGAVPEFQEFFRKHACNDTQTHMLFPRLGNSRSAPNLVRMTFEKLPEIEVL